MNGVKVTIINGNHEDKTTYRRYGLLSEGITELIGSLRKNLDDVLTRLPAALFMKYEGDTKYYQLCHGGIDYTLDHDSNKFLLNILNKKEDSNYSKVDIIKQGLKYDENGFKWSDFAYNPPHLYIWDGGCEECDIIKFGQRGAGSLYGPSSTKQYLDNNNLHSIISGHQDTMNLGFLENKEDVGKLGAHVLFGFYKGEQLTEYKPNPEDKVKLILNNPNDNTDFLALVTSTATGPKWNDTVLNTTTYLMLEHNTHPILNAYFIPITDTISDMKQYKEINLSDRKKVLLGPSSVAKAASVEGLNIMGNRTVNNEKRNELKEKKLLSKTDEEKDIISIITSRESTLRELIEIIYNNFDNLKSTLLLFNILFFKTNHGPTDSVFSIINDKKFTYRSSVISRGTKILFDKYDLILSNLLTFVYFFVKYFKDTGKDLSEIDDFDNNAYKYINSYMPLPSDILYNMNTPLNHFNSIQDHVMSGGRHFHLFISSSEEILPGYISRAIQTAKPGDIPVIMKIEISSENPAIVSQQENDHVLSSFIPSKFINSINRINKQGEIGEKIDLKTLEFPPRIILRQKGIVVETIISTSTNPNNEIWFYDKGEPYYQFTNFHERPINVSGQVFRTTETYFQLRKGENKDKDIISKYNPSIHANMTGRQAFEFGKSLNTNLNNKEWNGWGQGQPCEKCFSMFVALLCKFTQHDDLKQLLLDTGDKRLVEKAVYYYYDKKKKKWEIGQDKNWGDSRDFKIERDKYLSPFILDEGNDSPKGNQLGISLMMVRSILQKKPDISINGREDAKQYWNKDVKFTAGWYTKEKDKLLVKIKDQGGGGPKDQSKEPIEYTFF